jgi:hypothetical protein
MHPRPSAANNLRAGKTEKSQQNDQAADERGFASSCFTVGSEVQLREVFPIELREITPFFRKICFQVNSAYWTRWNAGATADAIDWMNVELARHGEFYLRF